MGEVQTSGCEVEAYVRLQVMRRPLRLRCSSIRARTRGFDLVRQPTKRPVVEPYSLPRAQHRLASLLLLQFSLQRDQPLQKGPRHVVVFQSLKMREAIGNARA